MLSRTRALTCALLFLASLAAGWATVRSGDMFPSLSDAGLTGGNLPDTAGKVVLVDFWASWCAPCKASFPALARLHQDYSSKGLVIVAVSVDEKPAAYTGFVREFNPPLATLHDQTHKLVTVVDVPAMPTSFVVDRHGRVRFVHVGFHGQSTESEWRRQIETLLAEKE